MYYISIDIYYDHPTEWGFNTTLKEPIYKLDFPVLSGLDGEHERLTLFSDETFCRVSKAGIEQL